MTPKLQITTRLIETVREYFTYFDKPIPLHILASKYSRTLSKHGGFHETIGELKALGLIQISLRESGGKDVYPARIKVAVNEKTRLLKR